MTPNNRVAPQKVEFRWRQHETDFAQRLVKSAREADRSTGDQARELVKTALTADEQLLHAIRSLEQELAQVFRQLKDLASVKQGLRTVHENVYQFRDDFATCVCKLLIEAGNLPPEAAQQWLQKALQAE